MRTWLLYVNKVVYFQGVFIHLYDYALKKKKRNQNSVSSEIFGGFIYFLLSYNKNKRSSNSSIWLFVVCTVWRLVHNQKFFFFYYYLYRYICVCIYNLWQEEAIWVNQWRRMTVHRTACSPMLFIAKVKILSFGIHFGCESWTICLFLSNVSL